MKERIKTVKKDNKLLAALKWTGIFFLLILGLFYIEFLVSGKDESITEHLFRNNIEKYVGEIEFLKSKSELSSKGAYFRVEGYPHSIYHYSSNDIFAYHDKVNSIKINELYYKEIKEVLESYFKSQEAVFHFTCNISYSDLNEKKQGILDVSKSFVEEICASESTDANFSISVDAVFPNESCVDLDAASRDLYLVLRDEYAKMDASVSVYLANTNDIYFFEDQKLGEYISYSDKRLISANACVNGKMDYLFWDDSCDVVSKKQPEGIMNQLAGKYEEFYGYRFRVVDYSCTEESNKAVCSYTIERVKNGLTYEGNLVFEECSSIREHIRENQAEFKKQMKIK